MITRLILALFLFVSSPLLSAYSIEKPVFVIAYVQVHHAFAIQFQEHLSRELPKQVILAQQLPLKSLPQNAIIITLGKTAFLDTVRSPSLRQYPVLATLISSRDYYDIHESYAVEIQLDSRKREVSALFSDPSPFYQLQLCALLIEKPAIAFIYDELDRRLISPIRQQAQVLKLPDPVFLNLKGEEINTVLKRSDLVGVDFVLATPNRQLYNSKNAKNIIFSLLGRKQALIGYSTGWVNSGALASVYSNPDDMVKSLADTLRVIISSRGRLPTENYPNNINIKINRDIAMMLDLSVVSDLDGSSLVQEGIPTHVQ